MEESSHQDTTFTEGTLGFFQCECMPFGLCNALATFQCLMTNCLGELNYSTYLVYLDDIVIYSSTQGEDIEWLRAILEQFRLHGLKLKPSKCEFFKEKIEYLGHSVSSNRVWPSRDNLKAIAKYSELTMYTPHQRFRWAGWTLSMGWELCCPRSSQTGDITLWLLGVEHYMEQRSITTVLNLRFWPSNISRPIC